MSKELIPLYVEDISGFARSLRRQLDGREKTPGHVEMLNLLAKANGFRNFQHFRAKSQPIHQPVASAEATPDVNLKHVKLTARHYDETGRLTRWPGKYSLRLLCLWVLWSRIPARTRFSEPEINERINDYHLFEDHALLRRELVDRGFLTRTEDGRQYERIEQCPTPEAIELLAVLRDRMRTSA